jgi:hypothetical protein
LVAGGASESVFAFVARGGGMRGVGSGGEGRAASMVPCRARAGAAA